VLNENEVVCLCVAR